MNRDDSVSNVTGLDDRGLVFKQVATFLFSAESRLALSFTRHSVPYARGNTSIRSAVLRNGWSFSSAFVAWNLSTIHIKRRFSNKLQNVASLWSSLFRGRIWSPVISSKPPQIRLTSLIITLFYLESNSRGQQNRVLSFQLKTRKQIVEVS
jgi:hypothetical protein